MIIISRCGNEHYETVYTDRFFKANLRTSGIRGWIYWQEELYFVLIMQISMGFNPMYSAMSWVFSRRQSFRVVGVLGKS
ncbi:hypothetical protein NC651_002325 [Populus alba x Populus x berolinensis]|nr:hypothetical protein NC651_002325 [Populus alba x Populus x berolinensis]